MKVGSHEFVRFDEVRTYPKPVRDRRIPVVLGGNSDTALEGAAEAVGLGPRPGLPVVPAVRAVTGTPGPTGTLRYR
jgi:alkanesulfonate monooxygenase SsuD/methylene tetrahydromethanopterin reductase-like flavin-dependent oxidoreductase (luciferase family)